MCELLDPDGALFGDRIIAAVDSGGADLSKRLMQARHNPKLFFLIKCSGFRSVCV